MIAICLLFHSLLLAQESFNGFNTFTNTGAGNGVGDFIATPYYGDNQQLGANKGSYDRGLFIGATGGYGASSNPEIPLGGTVLLEGSNNMVYGIEYLKMSKSAVEQEVISHGLYVFSKYHIIDFIIGYNVEFAYDFSILGYIGSGATIDYTNYFSIASFTAGAEARYMISSILSLTGGYKNISLLNTPHIEQHHLLMAGIKLSLF